MRESISLHSLVICYRSPRTLTCFIATSFLLYSTFVGGFQRRQQWNEDGDGDREMEMGKVEMESMEKAFKEFAGMEELERR